MAKLNFTTQSARKRPIKPVSDRYKESAVRPNIEEGDGIRPHMPLIPLRFLDVKYKDITTEEFVVVPKGRIISAITVQNTTDGDVLNLSKQDTAGDVPVGTLDQTADTPTPLYVGADESYYGYTRDIAGLLVPANGGVDRTITYDAYDVEAGVPNASTGAVVSVGQTYTLPANAPIGIAFNDVYQDIRGANLNYELFRSYGILAEQHIKIPFVDFGLLRTEAASVNFVDYDESVGAEKSGYKVGAAMSVDPTLDAGYIAAENKYSFLYFDSANHGYAGLAGQFLVPDIFGNWVPQGAAADENSQITLNGTRTAQTVGRLLFCDTRFPRDLMDVVETPYGHRVAGTGTAGLSQDLFDFIYTVLSATGFDFGTKDAAKHAIELVQAGAFGYAHIQVMSR